MYWLLLVVWARLILIDMSWGSDSFLVSSSPEVFGAPSSRCCGRVGREVWREEIRPGRSLWAGCASGCFGRQALGVALLCVGLTCKGFVYFSFPTQKHGISSKYIAVSTVYLRWLSYCLYFLNEFYKIVLAILLTVQSCLWGAVQTSNLEYKINCEHSYELLPF